ncbi:glycosyltransferase [Photobacterium phosphoreum]|uniref:glycosyltransferase n=1 Tax=Photobacterium phosphoreum TaxID=659 RepID=UPI0039AF573D
MKVKFIVLDITLKGGIERVTTLLANGFNNSGVDVEIISVFKKNEEVQFPINDIVDVNYLTKSTYNTNGVINKIKTYIVLFFNLYKLTNKLDINSIVISNYPNISIFLGFIRKFKRKFNFIASEHSQYAAHSKLISFLRCFFYKEAKFIVTLTEHDKKIFSKFFGSKKVVKIPNPVSFKTTDRSSSIANKKLITIGRLEDVKGYMELIDSIKLFFYKNPDWNLEIYGDGSLRNALENKIIDNRLCDNVFLKGFSNNLETDLKGASFYICSSKTEAFPMSFLEVLSMGIPVISLDCPVGPREIIKNNRNGFLVDNLECMNNKLLSIVNYDNYTTLATNSVNSIKKYDMKKISEKWFKLFDE